MKNTLFIVTALLVLSACSERIEIELDSTYERQVVEGHLTTDTTAHWVRLTRSKDYFVGDHVPLVSNALVTLSDGNGSIQL